MSRFQKLLLYVLMSLAAVALVGPFLMMMLGSFRDSNLLMPGPFFWFPKPFTLGNFITTLNTGLFPRWFLNSVLISTVPVASDILLATVLGYIFAKRRFPGREVIFWTLMATLMVPGQVLLVPRYLEFSMFHWLNTYWSLIVPGLWGVGSVFLMRQFIMTIPDELEEAARMDGAGDLRVIFQVIIPLARPPMAVLAIFGFIGAWNDLLNPLIFINDQMKYPLSVGLATMLQQQPQFGLQMAGAVLSFLPTFIVYIFLQKHLTKGIALMGMKG